MTRIYLVRHGRTTLNAQGRFRGRADPPLDDLGRQEAHAAGRALRGAGLTALYTSPLLRAQETAEAVALETRVPPRVVPGFADLDYGRWEGKTRAEASAADPEAFARFRDQPQGAEIPGGESVALVKRRLLHSLKQIAREHPGGRIGAVTHEILLRLALSEATGQHALFWDRVIPTGSVWAVELDGDAGAVLTSVTESGNPGST